MNFSEKLKTLRKQKNLSQEELAEKIHVSRQAITKWESGLGLPDIENIIAVSVLFNESLDSLLKEEKSLLSNHEFLYESKTEYDLDNLKKIDFKIGSAHEIIIEQTKDEKIQVLLASNKISFLSKQAKVKIVENEKRMDIIVNHSEDFSEANAFENLFVLLHIPEKFVADMEINSETENLKIRDITFEKLEFSGKVSNCFFTNANGHTELDTNSNLYAEINNCKGRIDFNQLKSISKIQFAKNSTYYLKNAGRKTRFLDSSKNIITDKREKKDPKFETNTIVPDLIVELNGWKSEMQIL